MPKTIITATPPTPNGDLHVGHLSGPYLAADVHARFLRARGEDVAYVSSSDDNQSYVVTTAHRLGTQPKVLASQQAERIRETLAKASIAIDAFTVPDQRHVEFVQKFFLRLYNDGVLTRKKKCVFWCKGHRHYAFESYLRGYCAQCFSPTAGATGNRLIQFLGYDNSFFFAVVHLILAMAARDRCILPTSIMTNEFYQLENFKFSTSKNHAIWARDLLAQRTVDETRFYLALSNPEFQKTNFAQAEMDRLVGASFAGPWQTLASGLGRLGRAPPGRRTSGTEISPESRALAAQLIASFERHYAIETFSLQRAAELFSQLLTWLGHRAHAVADAQQSGPTASQNASEIWAITRLIPSLICPLLPDFADRLDAALGQKTCHRWPGGEPLAASAAPVSGLGRILPTRRA